MNPVVWYYPGTLLLDRGTPIRVRHLIRAVTQTRPVVLVSPDDPFDGAVMHQEAPSGSFAAAKAILAAVRRTGASTVIGSTFNALPAIALVKMMKPKLRVVFEMHGIPEEEEFLFGHIGRVQRALWRLKNRLLLRFPDLVTTCGASALPYVAAARKTEVVFGGVDTDAFRPDLTRENIFDGEGLTIVGYAGNPSVYQGLDLLVAAFKEARTRASGLRLALWLSSQPAPGLAALLKGDPSIKLFSSVPYEAMPQTLSSTDVLAVPRRSNTVNELSFPSKLPEYLATGRAVVATDVGDAKRFVDGETGLLVPPEDTKALADALVRLADPGLRARLGRAGRARAEDVSWKRQGDRFTSLL